MEIRLENISKNYGDNTALDNINCGLIPGVYGLLGENGAGKSTMMKILTTVLKPSSGQVYYNKENIFTLGEKYRKDIGYLPQDFGVYPTFSGYDFLTFMALVKGVEKRTVKSKVEETLELVHLKEDGHKKVKHYSGGMKRRLGIAQGIINDPKILILDEPTAGLDPIERLRFYSIISEMGKDKIILVSTHIVSDIEALTEHLMILKNGKIIDFGESYDFLERLKGKVFETTIKEDKDLNTFSKLMIIHRKGTKEGVKIRFISHSSKFLPFVSTVKNPTLEDYFIYKIQED